MPRTRLLLIPLFGLLISSFSPLAQSAPDAKTTQTAIFAGGCFWCIEADFEKLDGVIEVESGYTGGSAKTANYKAVSRTETGHYEAVEVHYNPREISYAQLVDYFWRHIDPTDAHGQFCDKGSSYRSAIFYANDEQREIAMKSLLELQASKPFAADIVTPILPTKPFYLAETYHQDYYKKNPIRYRYYRNGCGRDQRVAELWGGDD
ncbi:peptide methionine sulfoxide reductase MsrA [Arenicella chitinivorans]|uniref:Peptide methionine sulfoxide reductase MsrA n=1 Tax=Arenicella chitinivorans TaxID=1329800 RepID=A0A918RY33_9GAMM|nr:peptide-methionine (S)-S-oxide reductase MsrA [Arenicella chitinivorans]GHA15955.1 peptide methionine sulfoxide reductase MsrA [Arenicella chitinivorans]